MRDLESDGGNTPEESNSLARGYIRGSDQRMNSKLDVLKYVGTEVVEPWRYIEGANNCVRLFVGCGRASPPSMTLSGCTLVPRSP
jgi:hypothetical protein